MGDGGAEPRGGDAAAGAEEEGAPARLGGDVLGFSGGDAAEAAAVLLGHGEQPLRGGRGGEGGEGAVRVRVRVRARRGEGERRRRRGEEAVRVRWVQVERDAADEVLPPPHTLRSEADPVQALQFRC